MRFGLAQVTFVAALIQLYNAFAPNDLTADQVTAVMVIATPLTAFVQNFFEDRGTIPSVLKSPASSGADPMPKDGGTVT